MKVKFIWFIIVILLVTNSVTAWMLTRSKEAVETLGNPSNAAAYVGEKQITEKEWLSLLKKRYGQLVIEELINKEVVFQLAEQEGINVSNEEIKQYIALFGGIIGEEMEDGGYESSISQEQLYDNIRYSLLLEELVTRDVVIQEEELRHFYEENQSLFTNETMYRLAHIVVPTKEEAQQVISELRGGSDFSTLARERSIDQLSVNQGGDLGFLSIDSPYWQAGYKEAAAGLKKGEHSEPIPTAEGYAILNLLEKIDEKSYTLNEVKTHVRRLLALQQLGGSFSPKQFWDEVGVQNFTELDN